MKETEETKNSEVRCGSRHVGHHAWVMSGSPRPILSDFVIGGLLAALFFAWQVPALEQRGWTYDESESKVAGDLDLTFLRTLVRGELTRAAMASLTHHFGRDLGWHELSLYYFVCDSARAGFMRVLARHGWSDHQAMHLFHTFVSASAVVVLYLLVVTMTHHRRLAVLCTLALMLLPKFIGHSQNNPKDLPALFLFLLAVYAVVSLTLRGGWWRAAGAGVVLGLALTH